MIPGTRLLQYAAGLDLGHSEEPGAEKQLRRDRTPWNSLRFIRAEFRSSRGLCCVPWAHLAGKAARPRHPDRPDLGIPLKIAAKVDNADEAYFREQIEPMLQQPGVEFIGEIKEREKRHFSATPVRFCFRSTGRSPSAS